MNKKIFSLVIICFAFTGCSKASSTKTDSTTISSKAQVTSISSTAGGSTISSKETQSKETGKEKVALTQEEAIKLYESTITKKEGERYANMYFSGKFYDKEFLDVKETKDNKIALSLLNKGKNSKDVIEFAKNGDLTEITFFDSSYPENPLLKWTVKNDNYEIVKEENINKKSQIVPFTPFNAFKEVKTKYKFNDDIELEKCEYQIEKKAYELTLTSKELKQKGGSGVVGIYFVSEDGDIEAKY